MDANNSINNCLTALFQEISISGITDSNKQQLESFFIALLDTPNREVFKHPLFYQLLLLIEREPVSNKVLSLLLDEIKLKSLRVAFTPEMVAPTAASGTLNNSQCIPTQKSSESCCNNNNNNTTEKRFIQKTRPIPPRDNSIFDGISSGLLSKVYWENENKSNE